MEWSRLALSDYATAALGVPAVGRGLGQFLAWLSSVTGAPLSNMHLVGFSLGAHLVGNAGRELGGRVARVTGKYITTTITSVMYCLVGDNIKTLNLFLQLLILLDPCGTTTPTVLTPLTESM